MYKQIQQYNIVLLILFKTGEKMALTKKIVIDKIEVLEMGQIQVRSATRIYEDGEFMSQTFHRHVITPDKNDISDQDTKVQAIANAIWTQDVKDAWIIFLESN